MAKQTWQIDSAHSGIHFSVRHMLIAKVRGQFARWSGSVLVEDGDLTRSKVSVKIDASSIDTGLTDRDDHLRSPDFFDASKFPEITFESTGVKKLSDTALQVTGDLTIRGVSREVVLDVEYAGRAKDPWGNERAGFTAKTSVDRKDFGLTWNQVLEAGGVMVGDQVNIEIEVEAVKQTSAQAA